MSNKIFILSKVQDNEVEPLAFKHREDAIEAFVQYYYEHGYSNDDVRDFTYELNKYNKFIDKYGSDSDIIWTLIKTELN